MKRRIKMVWLLLLMTCSYAAGRPEAVLACGPEEWDPENAITLLLPELADEAVIWRYNESEENIDLRQVNSSDWQDFFWTRAEGFVNRDEIEYLIYEVSLDDIEHARQESRDSDEEDEQERLSRALRYLSQDTIDYLIFAKQCEQHFAEPLDPWEDVDRDKAGMQRLLEEGRLLYDKSQSDFLKLRYAYQLMRLARFMGNHAGSIALYDELIPHLEVASPIQNWALDQKAGCLGRVGKQAEALYLFSLVFERSPERRLSAYRSFQMMLGGEERWKQCLNYAKSNHEKSVLWALWNSVNGYGKALEFLRNVYEFNPASPVLESLLVHELRKIERDDQFSQEYITQLKQFVLEAAALGKVRQAAFWYAMAGYLAMMEQKWGEADRHLNTAESLLLSRPSLLTYQISLLRHIRTLFHHYGEIDAEFEQKIYEDIETVSADVNEPVIDSVLALLAQEYLLQGNVPKAILCLFKASGNTFYNNEARSTALLDTYAMPEDLAKLHDLMTQPSYTPFEAFLLKDSSLTPAYVLEVQGTLFLRKHQFQEAYRTFKRIPESYWKGQKLFQTSFSHNPFHQPSHPQNASKKLTTFSKLSFTEKILELEFQAAIDPTNADWYYWQIGNAFYHTHAWGHNSSSCREHYSFLAKYRYAFNLLSEASWDDIFAKIETRKKLITKDCEKRESALLYYQKVLKLTRVPELGAEAALLAHSCQNPIKSDGGNRYSKYFWSVDNTTYFQVLQDQFQDTAFYDRLIEECATFKSFVNKKAD